MSTHRTRRPVRFQDQQQVDDFGTSCSKSAPWDPPASCTKSVPWDQILPNESCIAPYLMEYLQSVPEARAALAELSVQQSKSGRTIDNKDPSTPRTQGASTCPSI